MIVNQDPSPAPDDRPIIPDTMSSFDIPAACILLEVRDVSLKGEHPIVTLVRSSGDDILILTMSDVGIDDPFWSNIQLGQKLLVPFSRPSPSKEGEIVLHFRYMMKFCEDSNGEIGF